MHYRRRCFPWSGIVAALALMCLAPCLASAQDDAQTLLDRVQGDWSRTVKTPAGPVTIVKRHAGNRSIVTTTDANGNVLTEHESQFSVKQEGPIAVFTFFNLAVTAGPQKGRYLKEPRSFAFRVDDKQFVEAYGLLKDDREPPAMHVWERVK